MAQKKKKPKNQTQNTKKPANSKTKHHPTRGGLQVVATYKPAFLAASAKASAVTGEAALW